MCTYIAIKIMSLESGGNGKDEKEETSNISKMVSLININVFLTGTGFPRILKFSVKYPGRTTRHGLLTDAVLCLRRIRAE